MPDVGPVNKNPGDDLTYAIDFGNQPELAGTGGSGPTETFTGGASPTMSVAGVSDGALTIGAATYQAAPGTTQLTRVAAEISGGTSGKTYLIAAKGNYASGHARVLTGMIVVNDGSRP